MTDYGGSKTPKNERGRWSQIKGYEGIYEISTLGEIRSLPHKDYMGRLYPGKNMKPLKHPRGYLGVGLCKDGVKKRYLIHRLVAMTFIPCANADYVVNHKNGDKKDNSVCNLEWCSASDNNKHAYKLGLNYISIKNKRATSERMKLRHAERRKNKNAK
ncbi:NUMOD4 motif-containing HNH endonuclease [Klebsiella quasipneumoniae]|uniref:NUMOD4 domain-containing protein n=1 Tax=Klebsiella pneumoniae complex TaxID=3390273 RepID=UPI000CCFE4F7|nr:MULTISPECIES: NUMOD4 domain-containing protein [Klebsiella]HDU3742931.1 HNH endonuclease [Klebsiella pneumoniae subsp. pneumoniae]AUV40451.1 hypothetical protein C2U50_28980 [Klebsiella pneumoniae]MBV0142497.1 NUMOD4 motif-containing HNH endonuclease [Klebsiella quasipneumoniae]MCQ0749107.1 NUMOD4 motif-containing HNH endonuclease [Klebsiella pneumoniae]HBR1867978.1 HNH endonuclease [Klebsiella pneumoniae]